MARRRSRSLRHIGRTVVLLDIGLPSMDGYEVARRSSRDRQLQGSVIVAVSGYGQDDDRRRTREAGFNFHLVKPIDHDALLTLLTAEKNLSDTH